MHWGALDIEPVPCDQLQPSTSIYSKLVGTNNSCLRCRKLTGLSTISLWQQWPKGVQLRDVINPNLDIFVQFVFMLSFLCEPLLTIFVTLRPENITEF